MHRKLINALTVVVLLTSLVILPAGAKSPKHHRKGRVSRWRSY
jgi:hypothetical protein